MTKKASIILSNIDMYQKIVDRHYCHYLKLNAEHEKKEKSDATADEINNELYNLEFAMDCDAAVILVFSQMTIEAFCNAYLSQHISKTKIKDPSFITKINLLFVTIFDEKGEAIEYKDAYKHYDFKSIKKLNKARIKFVHRDPVEFSLNLDSDEAFQQDAVRGIQKIEENYLRRIKDDDVKNAVTAYPKLLNKLREAGLDFEKIGFIY